MRVLLCFLAPPGLAAHEKQMVSIDIDSTESQFLSGRRVDNFESGDPRAWAELATFVV